MRVSFSLGLTGGYTTDAGARPLALALEAEVPLRRDRDGGVTGELTGSVAAAAIAERAPAQGAVTLGRALRYDLTFLGDDGAAWRLTAEQRLATGGTPSAFTVARGSLRRGEEPSLPVELRFDPRADLRRLLKTLSLRR